MANLGQRVVGSRVLLHQGHDGAAAHDDGTTRASSEALLGPVFHFFFGLDCRIPVVACWNQEVLVLPLAMPAPPGISQHAQSQGPQERRQDRPEHDSPWRLVPVALPQGRDGLRIESARLGAHERVHEAPEDGTKECEVRGLADQRTPKCAVFDGEAVSGPDQPLFVPICALHALAAVYRQGHLDRIGQAIDAEPAAIRERQEVHVYGSRDPGGSRASAPTVQAAVSAHRREA
mmetsp:Transcript_107887/g.315407  ORF Transcript_107887/g.315407 Transcript_107887/m.315407 type:complete len:233 (-) Transcript_107887:1397-2095(-)